ncbi:hypothetical protein ACHHYP_20419 [Achlya hypogyna]|uniref:Uncharacterized protein n=1 Tax=Achlya hypogyna TaxID=1202772 RepID=A0A1V9YN91_ACHHY|nr:hypothetical protein ACHHYP_20419 [Achlya hypogyna]
MHDAFLERLWYQTVIQCDPVLRQVLQPLCEPTPPPTVPSPTLSEDEEEEEDKDFDLHGNVLTSVKCHFPVTPRSHSRKYLQASRPQAMPLFVPVLTTKHAVPYRMKLRSKDWHASNAIAKPPPKAKRKQPSNQSNGTTLPKIHH